MNRFLSVFLTLCLINGFSPQYLPAAAPSDCAMCGEVCCCPEACAEALKSQAKKPSLHESCQFSYSVCKLDAPSACALLGSHEKIAPPAPTGFLNAGVDANLKERSFRRSGQPASFALIYAEILTPPPRLAV